MDKKFKLISLLAISAILLGIGMISVYAIDISSIIAEKQLNEEKKTELQKIQDEGKKDIGQYVYKEHEVVGEADPLLKKLTLKDATDIIKSKNTFSDILSAFEEKQPYPDFVGGSGLRLVEYWLDDAGNTKIVIILEQGQIYHEKVVDNTHASDLIFDSK